MTVTWHFAYEDAVGACQTRQHSQAKYKWTKTSTAAISAPVEQRIRGKPAGHPEAATEAVRVFGDHAASVGCRPRV